MLKLCFFLSIVFLPTMALCLSDGANPWLALENVNCKKHLTINYHNFLNSFGDVDIDIKVANWKGFPYESSSFCELEGLINSIDKFKIFLPMEWNGKYSLHSLSHYRTEFFNHDAVYLGNYTNGLAEIFFSFVISNHYREINKTKPNY